MAAYSYGGRDAESVEKDKAPKAISIIMLAGIVSAFLGISSANYTKDLFSDFQYVGSYLMLAIFTFMPTIFLSFYENNIKDKNKPKRPLPDRHSSFFLIHLYLISLLLVLGRLNSLLLVLGRLNYF